MTAPSALSDAELAPLCLFCDVALAGSRAEGWWTHPSTACQLGGAVFTNVDALKLIAYRAREAARRLAGREATARQRADTIAVLLREARKQEREMFAAELVKWCEEKKIHATKRRGAYQEVADHIRRLAGLS